MEGKHPSMNQRCDQCHKFHPTAHCTEKPWGTKHVSSNMPATCSKLLFQMNCYLRLHTTMPSNNTAAMPCARNIQAQCTSMRNACEAKHELFGVGLG